jgi:hypothetical protein
MAAPTTPTSRRNFLTKLAMAAGATTLVAKLIPSKEAKADTRPDTKPERPTTWNVVFPEVPSRVVLFHYQDPRPPSPGRWLPYEVAVNAYLIEKEQWVPGLPSVARIHRSLDELLDPTWRHPASQPDKRLAAIVPASMDGVTPETVRCMAQKTGRTIVVLSVGGPVPLNWYVAVDEVHLAGALTKVLALTLP